MQGPIERTVMSLPELISMEFKCKTGSYKKQNLPR